MEYAQQIKLYGAMPGGRDYYRPAKIKGTITSALNGRPQPGLYVAYRAEERDAAAVVQVTCLTYAFSRKVENLRAALALHFAYDNFCRVHSSLKVTPAMENGITDHIWDLSELIAA